MRRRGFSFPEMVLSTALFTLAMLVTFSMLETGTRAFGSSVLRQGLKTEAQRISRYLDTDLRQTHYRSITVERREPTPGVYRDALVMCSLHDWADPASYEAVTGRPIWDRYMIFYATEEPDGGKMIRQEINPDPNDPVAASGPYPFAAFDPFMHLNADPTTNADTERVQTLGSQVHSFQVETDDNDSIVSVSLMLRKRGGRKGQGGGLLDDCFQVELRVLPENSFPIY